MDVQKARYKTFDERSLFCYRVAAVVGLMMTSVLGYKDERALTRTARRATRIPRSGRLSPVTTSATIGNTTNIRTCRGGTYRGYAK